MNVLFLGKDKRYGVLIDYLSKKYNVECIGYENRKQGSLELDKYDMIILPMYGIKNGKIDDIIISQELIDKISSKCIIYTGKVPNELKDKNIISFMEDEDIIKENNQITVDGILDYIKNIKKDRICILGYGRIGKELYKCLKDDYQVVLGVNKIPSHKEVFFFTNNFKALKSNLENSDLIINTVPKNIIKEEMILNVNGHILDVASYPYGIDQHLVNKYSLNYYLYSSIPSKYDPERAGKILLKKF